MTEYLTRFPKDKETAIRLVQEKHPTAILEGMEFKVGDQKIGKLIEEANGGFRLVFETTQVLHG